METHGRRRAAAIAIAFSYASAGFAVVTGVVLVPLYLLYFDLGTYGAWLASGGVLAILGLVDPGFSLVISQRLASAAGRSDRLLFARIAGTGWIIVLLLAAILCAAGVALAPWVAQFVNAPSRTSMAIEAAFGFAVLGTVLTILQVTTLSAEYAWQNTFAIGVIGLVSSLVGTAIILIALFSGAGVVSLGLGVASRGATGFLLATPYAAVQWRRRGLPLPTFGYAELMEQVHKTSHVFAGRVASTAAGAIDSTLVAALITPSAAAVLALTNRVYLVAQMLLNPIAGATFPGIAHLSGAEPSRVGTIISELLLLSFRASAILMAIALAVNSHVVRWWLGEAAYGGWYLDTLLCVAAIITVRLNLRMMLANAAGSTGAAATAAIAEAVFRAIVCWGTIQWLGIAAVPAATLVSGGGGINSAAAMVLSIWL